MSKASDAYNTLHNAMTTTIAPCSGLDLFTADDLNAADMAVLVPICETCPLFALCDAFGQAARPAAGVWAGKRYATRSTTTTRTDDP